MKSLLLKVRDLRAVGKGKEILKGVDFEIRRGEVQALLGPNGSGKSTFCQVIMGNPKYKVSGEVFFEGKNIIKLPPEERVKLGLAMAWQSPPVIKGVKTSDLIEKISKNRTLGRFKEAGFLSKREVNLDLSGGEKKVSELMQVLALSPKLIMFDEIDSGLDIKMLERVAAIIKNEFLKKGRAILIVTHMGEILNFLKPDWTNVMVDGKIAGRQQNFKKALRTIKKYGYERCKECRKEV